MLARLVPYGLALAMGAVIIAAVWLHGDRTGRQGCEARHQRDADAESRRQVRELDRLQESTERLRSRASKRRVQAEEAAREVVPDAECRSVPESVRGLFPGPGRDQAAPAASVAGSTMPAVAEPVR